MSVSEADRIDIIATRPGSLVVKLVITDYLDRDDAHAHCVLLEEQLNTYVTFIASEQLRPLDHPPIPANPEVMICAATMYDPSGEGRAFFERAGEVLRGLGIPLVLERSS